MIPPHPSPIPSPSPPILLLFLPATVIATRAPAAAAKCFKVPPNVIARRARAGTAAMSSAAAFVPSGGGGRGGRGGGGGGGGTGLNPPSPWSSPRPKAKNRTLAAAVAETSVSLSFQPQHTNRIQNVAGASSHLSRHKKLCLAQKFRFDICARLGVQGPGAGERGVIKLPNHDGDRIKRYRSAYERYHATSLLWDRH